MYRSLLHTASLFAVLLLFVCPTSGQRGSHTSIPIQIHGQIRYAVGGRPAEFVLVRLEGFSGAIAGEATSDRSGRFAFTNLIPELYTVSIRTAGYKEIQQQVDLRTDPTDYVQLQLVAEDLPRPSPKRGSVVDANVPETARAEFEKGRAAVSEPRSADEGILHLENAIRLYPKYLEAMLLLGTAYMDKSEWDKAESELKQVLVIAPDTISAHFALGELYLRQRKYGEAEKEMLAGIKLNPKSAQGHFMVGRLYYELGDVVKAGPQVGTALRLNPNFARAHLLAANIFLHVRQTENAIVEFEEYLRLEPNGEFSERAKETVRQLRRTLGKG